MIKYDVQNAIINEMTPFLDEEQLYQLKLVLIKQLHGLNIIEEETALSTRVDDNIQYLERFRNEMKVNNMSPKTISQYYRSARNLLEYVDKNFRDITYDDVIYYFAMFSQRKGNNGKCVSKRSMDTQRKHAKAFFNWCVENEYIEKNPFTKFKKIKYEKMKKDTLSNAEIVMLRDACENAEELALIDFLLSTGVRVSECCAMNIKDIDFLNGRVKIYGEKTRKWRTVFLDAAAQKHLKEYLDVRPESDEDAVFVNKRKPHRRAGSHKVEDITKSVGKRAGIEKKCTVHLFRRTLATTLYKKGMALKDIAQILGNSVDILEKEYIIIDDCDIESNYKRCVA